MANVFDYALGDHRTGRIITPEVEYVGAIFQRLPTSRRHDVVRRPDGLHFSDAYGEFATLGVTVPYPVVPVSTT